MKCLQGTFLTVQLISIECSVDVLFTGYLQGQWKFPPALCCVCTDGFNFKMSDFFCFQGYCIDIIINSKHFVFGSEEVLDDIMFLVSAVVLKVKYKTFAVTRYKSSPQKGRQASFSVHILHRKLLFAFCDAGNVMFTL